jgi:WD40 repeat protein/serine/threonine protein kinase/DNA-binding XRE family transcriptional regulator
MSNDASLGQILKERRRALDLTQAELARRVGCAVVTIKKLEAGDLRPSRQVAERLAAVLQIPQADRTAFVRLARGTPALDQVASPLPERATLPVPAEPVVKGYTLHEQVGAGGFGVVYRATQASVGRDVAVKIILPHLAGQPEFIRRFEAEAQMVARLEHPHIVPLYDYWRDPSGAYLVMRYLRGGNLAARLAGSPLDLDHVLRVLDQVGAALMVAHRAGVIHRDVKPANMLLDEAGNAFLADFGIARALEPVTPDDVTSAGVIVGSPAYLSPEQLRDEALSPQTDQYSLGIVLYELITGRHPFAHRSPAEQFQEQLNSLLPPVGDARPELAALDAVLRRATAKRPAERYPDVAAFVADVARVLAQNGLRAESNSVVTPGAPRSKDQAPLPTADGAPAQLPTLGALELANPFKGLHAFGEADAEDFFGRGELIQRLLERLSQEGAAGRFLAVVGPSGSGKSSVVRAGLVPALRRGALPGSERWFIVEVVPGAHPLEEIELGLLRIARRDTPALMEQLQRDERGLLRAARLALPEEAGELVLVIDQFEELFTLVQDSATREHVLRSIVAAVSDPRSPVRVVVTLRADFYDRPLQHPALGELIQAGTEVVLPMREHEIEQAIVGPAARAGVVLEPGLVPLISNDLGEQPGTLPLLQYALTELFERREGRVLTTSAYQAIGGVSGALARRADELYDRLAPEQQVLARETLLRLVTLGEGVEDTRRRVRLAELPRLGDVSAETFAGAEQIDAGVRTVVEHFSRHRLLTLDRDPLTREPTIEVAHEALLRNWRRLRAWLDEARDDLRAQRRLEQAAAEWGVAGDDAFLATGARLAQFAALGEAGRVALNSDERAYIAASLAEQERREQAEQERQQHELRLAQEAAQAQRRAANRLRSLVGALVLFLLVAVGLSAFAFQQRNEAEANFTNAEAQRLAAEAKQIVAQRGNSEVAALLALRSIKLQYTPQGDEALGAVTTLEYARQIFTDHKGLVSHAVFTPDGRYGVTGETEEIIRVWDLGTGQAVRVLEAPGPYPRMAFSPDGQYLATSADDELVRLWRFETWELVREFKGHTGIVFSVAYASDGRFLLSGGEDGTARIWDVQSGAQMHVLAHTTTVLGVDLSRDGKYALTGDFGGVARIWDVQSGALVREYRGHQGDIAWVAFAPDSRTFVTAGYDGLAIVWEVGSGEQRHTLTHGDSLQGIAYSPDGRSIASVGTDLAVYLWDAETGQEIRRYNGHNGNLFTVQFSADGEYLITASFDGTARIWDARPHPYLPQYVGHPNGVQSAAIAPDGTTVLTGDRVGVVRLWETSTGQLLREWKANANSVNEIVYLSDSRRALTGTDDGAVRLWDLTKGVELRVFTGHNDIIEGITLSPDERFLLVSSENAGMHMWEFSTGQQLQSFESGGYDNQFSQDGSTIFSVVINVEGSGRLMVWDTASGKMTHSFAPNPGHTVFGLALSPDGKYVFTGSDDGLIQVWDRTTWNEVKRFVGHNDIPWSFVFSPDGRYLLSSSLDRTARLWDVETTRELRRYSHPQRLYKSIGFTPDGRRVFTASTDGTARLWDVDIQDTVAALCGRLKRDFTPEERAQYGIPDDGPTCAAGR